MKKIYTNKSLFERIIAELKLKELLPNILDYYRAGTTSEVELRDFHWDCTGDLVFGGNEGIYLHIYAQGDFGAGFDSKVKLGVFKTLGESKDDLYTMAKLQADFIWETRDFVNKNIDDFEHSGIKIAFFKDTKKLYGFSSAGSVDKNQIDSLVNRFIDADWNRVVITNNSNGDETIMKKEEFCSM